MPTVRGFQDCRIIYKSCVGGSLKGEGLYTRTCKEKKKKKRQSNIHIIKIIQFVRRKMERRNENITACKNSVTVLSNKKTKQNNKFKQCQAYTIKYKGAPSGEGAVWRGVTPFHFFEICWYFGKMCPYNFLTQCCR